MVFLTIVTKTNGEGFNFQEAIPKVDFIKVVSCSLYNSWHNLKKRGTVTVPHKEKSADVTSFTPGHYTLEYLEKQMITRVITFDHRKPFETEIYTPLCQLSIRNKLERSAMFDEDLTALMGVDRVAAGRTAKINLSSPTTYFIHCDLIDKQKNHLNGKMSDGPESRSLFRCWSWCCLRGSFFWGYCCLSYRSWGYRRRSCGRLCGFHCFCFNKSDSSQQED